MAKEEDVKRIELKVSVDCCDGCKRKVIKALSIKGVLKTEIHSSLPKVTVLGNVESQTLIKRLAKCGKTAEIWPAETKKQDKDDKKSETKTEVSAKGGNEKTRESSDAAKKSTAGASEQDNHHKTEDRSKCSNGHLPDRCSEGGDKRECKEKKESEIAGCEVVKNINPSCITASIPATVTALPHFNYVVNPDMAQYPAGSVEAAYAPRVYFTSQSYPPPTPYYTANAYSAPPLPLSTQDQHLYYYQLPPPVYHCPPPPQPAPSLPPQFGDYFNDENTAGCNIM